MLWATVVIYLSTATPGWRPMELMQFAVAYFIVPVVGLYFSLRSRFVLLAWLATLAVCFAGPQLMVWLFRWLAEEVFGFWMREPAFQPESARNELGRIFPTLYWAIFKLLQHTPLLAMSAQLALGLLLFQRLRVNLARRSFSLR